MTKIVFDIKRDNGYGKDVYMNGSLNWTPMQNSTTNPIPNMNFDLGMGAIEFDVPATDGTFLWTVVENLATSGGTPLRYERTVSVPDSANTINYLDLPDADPKTIFPDTQIA